MLKTKSNYASSVNDGSPLLQGYLSVCTFVLRTSDIARVIHSISSQQNNGTMIFSDIINPP